MTTTNEQQDARESIQFVRRWVARFATPDGDRHALLTRLDAVLAAVSAAAPDERALRSALASVVCNAANYPAEVGAHVLGRDLSRLVAAVTAAALAARPAPVVSRAPIKVEWGVILDDAGSTAVYDVLDQAIASATYADGTCPIVRIETWPHLPGDGYYETFGRTVADAPEVPPNDRGCRWCQAEPGDWCEYDCGSPNAAIAPEFRGDLDGDDDTVADVPAAEA